MRASRPTACSSASRTSRPPPSPQTKPSRSASKGREALVGSSLRVDMAFIWQKPAMVSGRMMASAPPAIITSASSRWMIFMASPMAWLPVAQAVTTDELGPLAPNRIEITPEAILMMIIGTKKGETRSIARAFHRVHLEVGVLDGHDRAGDRVLEEGIELAVVLLVDVLERLEAAHLARDARGIAGGVEARDRPDPGLARDQSGPELLGRVPDRGDGADSGDDDPFHLRPARSARMPLTDSL